MVLPAGFYSSFDPLHMLWIEKLPEIELLKYTCSTITLRHTNPSSCPMSYHNKCPAQPGIHNHLCYDFSASLPLFLHSYLLNVNQTSQLLGLGSNHFFPSSAWIAVLQPGASIQICSNHQCFFVMPKSSQMSFLVIFADRLDFDNEH